MFFSVGHCLSSSPTIPWSFKGLFVTIVDRFPYLNSRLWKARFRILARQTASGVLAAWLKISEVVRVHVDVFCALVDSVLFIKDACPCFLNTLQNLRKPFDSWDSEVYSYICPPLVPPSPPPPHTLHTHTHTRHLSLTINLEDGFGML